MVMIHSVENSKAGLHFRLLLETAFEKYVQKGV